MTPGAGARLQVERPQRPARLHPRPAAARCASATCRRCGISHPCTAFDKWSLIPRARRRRRRGRRHPDALLSVTARARSAPWRSRRTPLRAVGSLERVLELLPAQADQLDGVDRAHGRRPLRLGEDPHLAEELTAAELRERDLVPVRAAPADRDLARGDDVEAVGGVAFGDDRVAGGELTTSPRAHRACRAPGRPGPGRPSRASRPGLASWGCSASSSRGTSIRS